MILFALAIGVLCINLRAVGQEKDKKKTEPKKQANVYTNVADAPVDYKIQGEYVNENPKDKLAAQVVARGNGKFDIYLLQGGLPGAGWDPKSKKLKFEGKLDSDKTNMEFAGSGYKGSVNAQLEKLHVGTSEDKGAFLKRVERKSSTLGDPPPKGAIILFDGKNSDAWKPGKMTGDLLAVPNSTKQSFTNFKLHIEFRTPFQPTAGGQGRGNSGVYVCGREVQVLDSFGLKGDMGECGGLYGQRACDVNMCLPPLVWQTFDIEHRAGKVDPDTKKQGSPTITVRHNGVIIHENIELKGGANQGNINLQNHGNPVVYRNVWLVELK